LIAAPAPGPGNRFQTNAIRDASLTSLSRAVPRRSA
jgi:hypothetical protein